MILSVFQCTSKLLNTGYYSYDYNGVLGKNTLLLKGLSFNSKYTKSIFSPIWLSLSPEAMHIEKSSYSGIVLNIALFGPFMPLSMDK